VSQALWSRLGVSASSCEFSAEFKVFAVRFLKRGSQGCDALSVLLLQAVDLICQGEHERTLGVLRDGRGGAGAGLSSEVLDAAAEFGVPIEEGVGHAGLSLDGLEGDRISALDECADASLGGFGLRNGLGLGGGGQDGDAS